jgi:hypothetical protein
LSYLYSFNKLINILFGRRYIHGAFTETTSLIRPEACMGLYKFAYNIDRTLKKQLKPNSLMHAPTFWYKLQSYCYAKAGGQRLDAARLDWSRAQSRDDMVDDASRPDLTELKPSASTGRQTIMPIEATRHGPIENRVASCRITCMDSGLNLYWTGYSGPISAGIFAGFLVDIYFSFIHLLTCRPLGFFIRWQRMWILQFYSQLSTYRLSN